MPGCARPRIARSRTFLATRLGSSRKRDVEPTWAVPALRVLCCRWAPIQRRTGVTTRNAKGIFILIGALARHLSACATDGDGGSFFDRDDDKDDKPVDDDGGTPRKDDD